ncbi:hypothetical protein VV02_12730 [Luteipulveratus mongoliensis]|uniref:Glycoside hydrolase family 3 N-terminal domain-containing protein n=2 Tax=Luteipulveratus mongoliensis TaxID=571913 RepID=A0A0K1JQR4_9MICO|nr:hypothetical protein VV02_12730 [Luteipulveratus mongoliensis]
MPARWSLRHRPEEESRQEDTDDVRRLAHRVLMPGFSGTRLPSWLSRAIHDGLGGICVFGHNVESPTQLRAMTDDAHGLGRTLVAIDEEGGIVSRLGARQGSAHVGAAALGVVDDVDLTEQVARSIACDLRYAGVDIDLAPVVDVSSNPDNPVIGVRAFGADPEHVARHSAAFVTGLQSTGIAACAKHFPGHGDTNVDSHAGLPVIDADLNTLRTRELVPFRAAIEAGTQLIMTAHIVFRALDEQPATVSPKVIGLLRDELGFDGVITSDAMDMRAVAATIGMAEGSVQALIAGVDLIGLGNPVLNTPEGDDQDTFRSALEAIIAAVHEGRLDIDRLREAAGRIDRLDRWVRDRRSGEVPEPDPTVDARAATESLLTTGDVSGALQGPVRIIDIRRLRNIASGSNLSVITQALMRRLPESSAARAFDQGPTVEGRAVDGPRRLVLGEDERADVIVTGTPGMDPSEANALAHLLATSPDAIVICTGWVPDTDALQPARRTVRTFGHSLPTAEAVADLLTSP